MTKFKKNLASNLSTIIGLIVAVANSWANVEWSTFECDFKHIAPLVVSALIAIGGYCTSINLKVKTDQ